MGKYEVEVTETLQKRVIIEADNENNAIKKVSKWYGEDKIELCPEDLKSTEFDLIRCI